MDLKYWYLEREISKLQEEVYYWKAHYNKAMNFFLIATAQRRDLEKKINMLRMKNRQNKRRKK